MPKVAQEKNDTRTEYLIDASIFILHPPVILLYQIR